MSHIIAIHCMYIKYVAIVNKFSKIAQADGETQL